MKTCCPSCGTTVSLDALIGHDAAREALVEVFKLSGGLGSTMIKYLALFRPANRDLSMDRVAKLVGEMVPDIQAQRIERNRQVYEAPVDAWIWAMEQTLSARDNGRLTLPLKGHGFLYEVLTSYKPTTYSSQVTVTHNQLPKLTNSKTVAALAALECLK